MRRQRILAYMFLSVAGVFAGLFLLSRYAAPNSLVFARDDWLLAGVALAVGLSGLAALNDIWDFVLKLFGRQPELDDRTPAWELRNRQQLIRNVQVTWIHGVRDQALYGSVWIDLAIKFELDQVNRPWQMTWRAEGLQQPLEDTSIKEVFQKQSGTTLLVLGAPGSGKTITLLDLAQALLDEAAAVADSVTPLPVVFNLSSWAENHKPLQEWLIDELDRTYFVPETTARYWLDRDALILLLDGLDEVAEAQREACVEAINRYRREHGLTGMAVCSRTQEYEVLTQKLNLLGAVVIQPLSSKQADWYLKEMGQELRAVRKLLKEGVILRKWVQSPLFLYVVAMAYRGLSLEELRNIHTGSLFRLYDTYLTQVLERHRPHEKASYTVAQVRRWLIYLASRLNERGLTLYYIEQMQPDWLGERLKYQLGDGLITKGLKWMVGKEEIKVEDKQWSWAAAITYAIYGLLGGLAFGLIGWLLDNLGGNLGDDLLDIMSAGLVFGPLLVLVIALSSGLVSGLAGGLSAGNVRKHEQPNQGIWRTSISGLVVGSALGMSIGLIYGLGEDLDFGPILELGDRLDLDLSPILELVNSLKLGLFLGLLLGLAGGLFGGLLPVFIGHFALRRLLADFDYLPFRLVPFLEYARERLLIRRVGGAYIFIHRTLLEYFATQDEF